MKVLVVSDTHGRDESLEMAVALEQPFDYLIHCGDVEGREFFIEALAECPCTIVAMWREERFLLKLWQTAHVPLLPEIMIFSVIFQERTRFCWKDIRSW